MALYAPAEEVLYGGAAGGGKSFLMRAAAIIWCMAVPGLQVYLFRRTSGELINNHLQGSGNFYELLAPLISEKKVRIVGNKKIHFDTNGSCINLCHLQYANKSLSLYQGAEIHVLILDESTHYSESEYRYLRGRCRMGDTRVPEDCPWKFPRILSGTNPGGKGHHFFKSQFVNNGEMTVVQRTPEEGGMRAVFIPAKLTDNHALIKNDPNYADRLKGLGDPMLVKALLDGDWSVLAGAMFSTWRKHIHTCAPFSIPIDWQIWTGYDDGYASECSMLWLTQDPKTKTFYVVDEVYGAKLLPEELCKRIKHRHAGILRCDEDEELVPNDVPIVGLADSSTFKDSGNTVEDTTRGTQMRKMGIKITSAKKWNGSRVDGVQNLHRLLAPNKLDPHGGPGIVFFTHCKEAIRTIPALSRCERNSEDVDTTEEDHSFDSLAYGLQWTRKDLKIGKYRT